MSAWPARRNSSGVTRPSHGTEAIPRVLCTGGPFCLNGRMTDTSRAALLTAALAFAAGCQTAAPKPDAAEHDGDEAPARAPAFEWPKPEGGWKTETIPFPLDFAPTIPLQGVEELRFAPGMFKPEAPGYWS